MVVILSYDNPYDNPYKYHMVGTSYYSSTNMFLVPTKTMTYNMIIPAGVGLYDLIHNKILLQLWSMNSKLWTIMDHLSLLLLYDLKKNDYNIQKYWNWYYGLLFLVYCYLLRWVKK